MSPSAASTRLPQELINSLIDELRNDVGSLRTCSLASKPWVYRDCAPSDVPFAKVARAHSSQPRHPFEPTLSSPGHNTRATMETRSLRPPRTTHLFPIRLRHAHIHNILNHHIGTRDRVRDRPDFPEDFERGLVRVRDDPRGFVYDGTHWA